jgi:hypothetical protein
LTPWPSPPANYLAGIRPPFSVPFPKPAKDPIAKLLKLPEVLSVKSSFSFYSFSSELCKILEKCRKSEKCEINFVVFLLIRSIIWCDEFEIFPCVINSKNRVRIWLLLFIS